MTAEKGTKEIPKKLIDEKAVSECKLLHTFSRSVVGRNITILWKIEYDHVQT